MYGREETGRTVVSPGNSFENLAIPTVVMLVETPLDSSSEMAPNTVSMSAELWEVSRRL